MKEIERVERAAQVLDLLEEHWEVRTEAMSQMRDLKRKRDRTSDSGLASNYHDHVQQMANYVFEAEEAMKAWVGHARLHNLTTNAAMYRAMGVPEGQTNTTGHRGEVVKAGIWLSTHEQGAVQNLVQAPEIPYLLKNAPRLTHTKNAARLRRLHEAAYELKRQRKAHEFDTRQEAEREFTQALNAVWGVYPKTVLLKVCGTTAGHWLTDRYERGY